MKELIELLEAKINTRGELHLGKEHTELFIEYLKSMNTTLLEQDECINKMCTTLQIERRKFSQTQE